MRLSLRSTNPTPAVPASTPAPDWRLGKFTGALVAGVLLALGLSGCGSIKPVRYYQLTHPPTSTLAGSPAAVDVSLLVRPFQTSHLYREDRIVYGGEGEQVGLYAYDRWVEPPVEMLQDALARGLRSSAHFKNVTTLRSDNTVDFTLTGHLYAFREVSTGGIVARLYFDVQLIDLKLGKPIWRHTYNHDEPSRGKSVADIAAAMDKNVQLSVQEVHDGVIQTLANYSSK
ncbi:MAG TPA: ABC-type transport auxiliary lipoprotein family protein [Candidatus Limnocylindrales bacterium]|nr:ABC-type transport auxiliary lipoprotein family protein [Candidatus Limnocylindrales bacterium]